MNIEVMDDIEQSILARRALFAHRNLCLSIGRYMILFRRPFSEQIGSIHYKIKTVFQCYETPSETYVSYDLLCFIDVS